MPEFLYPFRPPYGIVSQLENNNEVRLNLYQIKPALRSGNIHLAIEINTLYGTTLLEFCIVPLCMSITITYRLSKFQILMNWLFDSRV
jgi:hypothetical protein